MHKEYYIMSNVRRILGVNKNKEMPNWVLYKEIFGVGQNTANSRCAEIGIDPDGHRVEKVNERSK